MREPSSLRRTAMAAIRVYQKMVSPLYGDVCNFYPSCSHYGFQAFQQHGFWQGLLLTSDRLQRCHFWAAGSGQYRVHAATGKLDDPVANHAWSATQPDNNGKGCEARAGNDRGNVSAEPEQ
jgi:putative membrane protein insertion efficiency factor